MKKFILLLLLVTAIIDSSFRIITVKHVYVGGIASLFKGAGIISTEPFVSPASHIRTQQFNQNNQTPFR